MKQYDVYIFTDRFKELVESIVISTAISAADETNPASADVYAKLLENGKKTIYGVFGLHWMGAERRNIPKEIFELEATKHTVTSIRMDKVNGGDVPIVEWEGKEMMIKDIPHMAYAEEMVDSRAKTQMYYVADQAVERLNCTTPQEAMQIIADKLAKGEGLIGGTIHLSKDEGGPIDDL